MPQYTERKKADREKMAAIVEAIAATHGATTERPDWFPEIYPRGVMVSITTPGGLNVSVDFSGESTQPDVFVLSWHMATDSSLLISGRFSYHVNEYHRGKATDICEGFDALTETLSTRLACIASGEAYMTPQEVQDWQATRGKR